MNRSVITSAPGRVGLVGNPTDMYGGSVISCSTVERARVRIQAADCLVLDAGTEQKVIASPEDLAPAGDIFDIARAALTGTESTDLSVHVSWSTDIPFRAGLSGSTALLVSMVAGLLAFRGIRQGSYQLAELVRMIEYQNLTFCGYQDAYMCTFGGLNYMDFRGKEFHLEYGTDPFATMEPIALPTALPVVVVITGGQRVSGGVHTPLRERWLAGEPEDSRSVQDHRRPGPGRQESDPRKPPRHAGRPDERKPGVDAGPRRIQSRRRPVHRPGEPSRRHRRKARGKQRGDRGASPIPPSTCPCHDGCRRCERT